MKASTKNKIKDWFIIMRIRILNFIKEHKYVSSLIGLFLMSAVVALVVKAVDNESYVSNAPATIDSVAVSTEMDNNVAPNFSNVTYTVNYTLKGGDAVCGAEKVNKDIYISDKVTITATLPDNIDLNNVKWLGSDETVESIIEGKKLTVNINNVNACAPQSQSLTLKVLNLYNKDNEGNFIPFKPDIKVQGGSEIEIEKASIASEVPSITNYYSGEYNLQAMVQNGAARYVSDTQRNAQFGVLLGIDSSSDIGDLKGKFINVSNEVILKAYQVIANNVTEDLKLTDSSNNYLPFGVYKNDLHYFTSGKVPDLSSTSGDVKLTTASEEEVPSLPPKVETSAPVITLDVPNNMEYEKYPEKVNFTDDIKVSIDGRTLASCSSKNNCEMLEEEFNIHEVNEKGYTKRYKVTDSRGITIVSRDIKVLEPQNKTYTLNGAKTYYLKTGSTYNDLGLYDKDGNKVNSSNYSIEYYDKNGENKVEGGLTYITSHPDTYIQKYIITAESEEIDKTSIERKIIVMDTLPTITSESISVNSDYTFDISSYNNHEYFTGDSKKTSNKCENNGTCRYNVNSSKENEVIYTYSIIEGNTSVEINRIINLIPTYYKLTINNLVFNGDINRISGTNFYAFGSYYVTVNSPRKSGDNNDFNIFLDAYVNGQKTGGATSVSKVSSTGEDTSSATNVMYVNENNEMVPVLDSSKVGLKGNYYTAAMGEDVEMISKFEYAYDADNEIEELKAKINVDPKLLPQGYSVSSDFSYYQVEAMYNGEKINALPNVSIEYCESSSDTGCKVPSPENYADENIIIDHINISIKKNITEKGNFEIKPGTVITLKTKYRVRTYGITSDEAKSIANMSFSNNIAFSWQNGKFNLPKTGNISTKPVYLTPYKSRIQVGLGKEDNYNYSNSVIIDASKNDIYTIYIAPDVVSPAMNMESNIFGYTKVNVPVTIELPEGVSYVYNENYHKEDDKDYTPSVSSNGRLLTYKLNSKEPNSFIEPIRLDIKIDVEEITKSDNSPKIVTHIGTYNEQSAQNMQILTNDLSSIDYFKTVNTNMIIQNEEIVSYGQYVYYNGKSSSNINPGDQTFELYTKLHNNEQEAVKDVVTYTLLPYNTTAGTPSYNGTFEITSMPEGAWCTDTDASIVASADRQDEVIWASCESEKFKQANGSYYNVTAYKVEVGTIAANGNNSSKVTIKTYGSKPDDVYRFKSFLSYTNPDGSKTDYKNFKDLVLDVVSKQITGIVWEDFNVDGIMDDDEKRIENVTLTLYDLEDNKIGESITPDKDGRYTFTAVPEGSYYILAEFNSEQYGATVEPSEDFYDETRRSVFKAFEITKNDTSKVEENQDKLDSESSNEDESEDEIIDDEDEFIDDDDEDTTQDIPNQEEQEDNVVIAAKTDTIVIDAETRIKRYQNLGLSLRKVFKAKIDKYIASAEVTNALGVVTKRDYGNVKLAKLDVKDISKVNIKVIYALEITNVKYYPGYATLITEEIPDGMSFNPDYAENAGWIQTSDNQLQSRVLSDQLIGQNEKKYLTIAFDIVRKEAGSFVNFASVDETQILGGVSDE